QLVGDRLGELPMEGQDLRRSVEGPEHEPTQHNRIDGMEAELEGGGDTEVAAPALEAPEELGVLAVAGGEALAVGRHQVDGHKVVARQPVLRGEPAETTPEGQAGDAGRG